MKMIDDAHFAAEVLASDLPVLVEIGTAWCGPCRALDPLVEEAASVYAGRLKVVALDADQAPESAAKFRVRGFPTMVMMHRGNEVARQLGLVSRARLRAWIDEHVAATV